MFERIVNSKVYEVVDRIVRIVWVNLLMLVSMLLGLFVFTFGASLMAGTYVIKLLSQKYEGPIFSLYIKAFKQFYKKSTILSLSYSAVLLIISFNVFYFIELMDVDFSWFGYFSFIVMLVAFIILFISMFHSMLLATCFSESSFITLVKSGIRLTFVFIARSLLFLVALTAIIALSWLIPILTFLISLFIVSLAIEFIIFKSYDKVNLFANISNKVADQLLI